MTNHRRFWLQRLLHRISPGGNAHLLPTLLLTFFYLAGAIHLSLQHCRLASLLCLIAAGATLMATRRHSRGIATSSANPQVALRRPEARGSY
jgi:hypothetical protein